MPSSTSSFETYELKRIVPKHHWMLLALLSVVVTAGLTLGWELYCRSQGYEPSINDSTDLWASRRTVLDEEPDRTVLIGSSRMLFDFDMDVYEEGMGERPLQLATVGTNPLPYLEDLADHPKFSGTVIVGVVPGLFMAPGGPPMDALKKHLDRYRDWSPTQKTGHQIARVLERRLAFLNKEDLTLNQLLLTLKFPNREKVKVPPTLPPHFHQVDEERQGGMTDFAANNTALQKRIQQIWLPLFTPPPPKEGLTPEEITAGREKMGKFILGRAKKAVDKIRTRGGKVLFLRLPSTGELRALENKFTPRAHIWDKLLRVTGAPGIHFEDYPQLTGFDCPEWSHLNKKDGTEFTRRLIPLLKEIRSKGKM
jgi:hypothetical protein